MDAIFDLVSSSCLALLLRRLLMDFNLVLRSCLSADLCIKKICGRYGIQNYFKGGCTSKNLLVSPKDKDPMVSQSDAIYWYQCGDLTYDDEYIGETSRTFGERYKEHLKDPSPIHHHNNQTNHPINQNNFKIIGREGTICLGISRNPSSIGSTTITLNNNIGKFNLPHIWDRVLINTPGLKLNK